MSEDDLHQAFERICNLMEALGLPGVSQGTSFGTPCLKVADKAFIRMKDSSTLVMQIPIDQKEMLIAVAPDLYFETEHYRDWPTVLIRLTAIGDDELSARLFEAWSFRAPFRLAQAHASLVGYGH